MEDPVPRPPSPSGPRGEGRERIREAQAWWRGSGGFSGGGGGRIGRVGRERDNGLFVPDETTWMDGRLDFTRAAGPHLPFRCGGSSRAFGRYYNGRVQLRYILICQHSWLNLFPSMDLFPSKNHIPDK
jgi:hypothetical protein